MKTLKQFNQKRQMQKAVISLLFIFLIFFPIVLLSQIEKPIKKGNMFIGGGLNSSYYKNQDDKDKWDSYKSVYFNVSPSVGYFIVDNLSLGISTQFYYKKNWGVINFEDKQAGIGPFVKYYFNNGIFSTLSFYYSTTLNNLDFNYSYYRISPELGYAFFINSKVSLELSLNYQYMKNLYIPKNYYSDNKMVGVYFNIGFRQFL